VVLAATAPAGPAAKPARGGGGTRDRATIRFQGSHGYRFEVEAHGGNGGLPDFVTVSAANGPASVRYLVRGRLTGGDSLNVHLPRVGRIAVEFDRTGMTRERRPGDCKGSPSIVEHGFFRGTIEIDGERGYTTVNRRSARGLVIRSPRKTCNKFGSGSNRSGSRKNKNGEITALLVGSKQGSLLLMAAVLRLKAKRSVTLITAGKTEFREGMLISTNVSVKGEPGDLDVSDPGEPKVVKLAPAAPFEGSATFELTSPKTSTWTGDLSVEMPGLGHTGLAGPRFESTVCEGSRCTKTAPGNIGELAGFIGGFFG